MSSYCRTMARAQARAAAKARAPRHKAKRGVPPWKRQPPVLARAFAAPVFQAARRTKVLPFPLVGGAPRQKIA